MHLSGKYDRIESVTIRPKVDNPRPFELDRETDYFETWQSYRVPASDTLSIEGIDLRHWRVELTTKKTPEFEAVSKIVGEDKASEVLEALGL